MNNVTLLKFKVIIFLTNIQAYVNIVDPDQMLSYWSSLNRISTVCHSIRLK